VNEETRLLRAAVEATILCSQPIYCDSDDSSTEAFLAIAAKRQKKADEAWGALERFKGNVIDH
jgi:hypothetical protein